MPAFAKIHFDGADQSSTFGLVSLQAREELGRVYRFSLTLLSTRGDFTPRQMLGKSVGVQLALHDGVIRHFNGIIFGMSRGPQQAHRHEYRLDVRPDFALLAHRSDARVFQNRAVPDVFKEVVARLPAISFQFLGSSMVHKPWEYCVQYQESDLHFALRLLEQEGIYFWFDHSDGARTKMVLLDDNSISQQMSQPLSTLSFNPNGRDSERPQDYLQSWERDTSIVPGLAELGDFDFKRPMQAREVRTARRAGHAADDMELFFYPGEFDTPDEGRVYADLRMQEAQAGHAVHSGMTLAPGVRVGRLLRVKGHPVPDMNGDFLVTATEHEVTDHERDAGSGRGSAASCRFTAIPATVQFRPPRITPKSRVPGPQTAFVVGPEGNEIHTDEYGRIRVQFHWDRYGKPTADTSCWIRTVQPWANQGFGFWALPRVGSEVVVQFLDGDPDRPIVTGSVYNAENRIPYPQPANKTRSGLRTLSSPEGGVNDYNELRFEDKKGEEEVYLQAQRDMNTRVKKNAARMVGADDSLAVDGKQNIQVKQDRSLAVDAKQTTSVGGDRQLSVKGNESHQVTGDRIAQFGSDSLQVQGDAAYSVVGSMGVSTSQSYDLSAQMGIAMSGQTSVDIKAGMTLAMNAGASLCISCGSSFISLTPAGIFIQGPLLMLNSGGAPVMAKSANPASADAVPEAAKADEISIAESPPVKPATQKPRAGALADAARTGAPFAAVS